MADTISSRRWVLARKVDDDINLSEAFTLETITVPSPSSSSFPADKLLLKNVYFSNDPSQRTWISSLIPQDRHYMKLVDVGSVMTCATVSEVLRAPEGSKYKAGDMVYALRGWEEHSLVDEKEVLSRVDINPADFMALGATGLTAYFGLYRIALPKETDRTIVVSGAAGATGSAVVQIAKNVLGIEKVVGIAGGESKTALLKELGCDIALDYKSPTFREDFEKATPDYIDIYWDNVGGVTLDMAVNRMARNGRIVACGAVSGYDNQGGSAVSMESWMKIVSMRVRVEGFIFSDYQADFAEGKQKLSEWVAAGKIKPLKTVWETGFEHVPEGMLKLLSGENVGKLVTKVV